MKKIIENNKCLYFLKELLKYKKEIGILSISTIVSTVTVFLQPLLIKTDHRHRNTRKKYAPNC